jgi:nicotinamidase-related amidase
MIGTYDRLSDLGRTQWLDGIRQQLSRFGDDVQALRHLMIYFDDGPCYEFICRSFKIEEVPWPNSAVVRLNGESMKSAVVIIDVQRGYFDAEPRPAEADAVIARINQLTARARRAGVPVIFVQHEAQFAFGSPGWELERQLQVKPGDHKVRKTTPDSFLRTELEELLSRLGVSRLIVCGYATEGCVDTTIRRAAALGYEVTIAADAHTTDDKPHASAAQIREHHNASLSDLTSFGPQIRAVNSADIEL